MLRRFALAGFLLIGQSNTVLAQDPSNQPEKKLPVRIDTKEEPLLKEVEFPGGHCNLYLLAQRAVQIDLGLSARQVKLIRGLVADLYDNRPTTASAYNSEHLIKGSPWFLRAYLRHYLITIARQRFQDHVQQLRMNEAFALTLLQADQLQRLKQVSLQYGTTSSFWDPLIRQQLLISDKQYTKIAAVPYSKEKGLEETEELNSIGKDFFDFPKRTEEAWQMREWRRIAVLTPTQRVQWKEMLGKPFKGPIPSPVLIPEISKSRRSEHSIEELKEQIKALRGQLDRIEKRLSEFEKRDQR